MHIASMLPLHFIFLFTLSSFSYTHLNSVYLNSRIMNANINFASIMQSVEENYGPLTIHESAYLFFPTQKQQKTEEGKKGARFFFFGQVEHDEYERKKLHEFHDYVAKNKIDYNREVFDEQRLLLFLQGHSYKPKQTIESLNAHLDFRKQYLPPKLPEKTEKMIRSGFFYPCGRDKNFRPILVFNATLVDFKDVESGLLATIYVHEEIIKNMFIPGQVENWVIIYDLGGMGVTEIPMSAIKSTTSKMGSNYGGRLFKMFTVNAPGTIYFTWKAISTFLDPVTVDKIKISKNTTEKSLFDYIDPSQVEQKYGGKQPNRKEFWPFKIPDAVYDEKRLISLEEYESKLAKGELKKNHLHPKFAEKKAIE